jgi:hypothetical protein
VVVVLSDIGVRVEAVEEMMSVFKIADTANLLYFFRL